jgi:predicted enzyme related to lactoylglutathione lyase
MNTSQALIGHGRSHREIVARDAERLANFYRQLFNWRIGEGEIKQVPAGWAARSQARRDTCGPATSPE